MESRVTTYEREQVQRLAQQYGVELCIFGSLPSGNGHDTSDLDIGVIVHEGNVAGQSLEAYILCPGYLALCEEAMKLERVVHYVIPIGSHTKGSVYDDKNLFLP